MRIRKDIRWIPLLAVVSCIGCGLRQGELNGDYSIRCKQGSEKLTLNTNGTFTQVYTPLGSAPPATNSGTWEFWKDRRSVVLRDVIEFGCWGQEKTQTLERIVCLMPVAKRFGKISLIVGEPGVEEFDKLE